MKIIVITGGIATGKSTILKQFRFLGVNSFSSDEMVDDIYKKDKDFFLKIRIPVKIRVKGTRYDINPIDWKNRSAI